VSNYQTLFNKKPSGGGVTGFGAVYVNPNSQLTFYFKGAGTTQGGGTTTATVNANSWYSFHLTCDVANDEVEIYLNGSLVSTISVDAGSTLANGHHQYFGSFNTSSYPFNGVLDEMRIALTDFSADWIATEYNNQNSPSTFYSVSSQQNATNPLPVDLISFLVIPTTNHTAQLNWMTASEINNSHFEIERSYDGRDFEMIDQVSGNGNSQHQIEYSYLDENISPMENTVFYRLKQLDFDGAFEYSDIRVVRFDALENDMQLEAYPNPFSDEVTLLVGLSQGENYSLEITDLKGRLMHQSKHTFKRGVHSLNLSKWDKGVYFAEVISEYGSEYLKIIKK
jgi:hypothetical protein